jgi:hypothetical protein
VIALENGCAEAAPAGAEAADAGAEPACSRAEFA